MKGCVAVDTLAVFGLGINDGSLVKIGCLIHLANIPLQYVRNLEIETRCLTVELRATGALPDPSFQIKIQNS